MNALKETSFANPQIKHLTIAHNGRNAGTAIENLVPSLKVTLDTTIQEQISITNVQKAADVFFCKWDAELIALQEQFCALYLDNNSKVIGFRLISTGGISGVDVDISLLFGVAMGCRAQNIILAHNHPSGCLKPSIEDKELTRRLIAGAELLGLRILDHIIVCPERKYYSFAKNNLIF